MKKTLPALCLLVGAWWIASLIVTRQFFPAPDAVFMELVKQIISGNLSYHLMVSLLRVMGAITFAFFPALILGIIAGVNARADAMISPVMYVLFPVPKIALLPVILLFLGLGNASKVFLVSLIVFFPFYLNIRDETHGLSRRYFDSLYSLGGNRFDLLRHIILPAILPRIFSTIRLGLGTAIAVLFLAETFATREGIGWFIMDAWSRLSYEQMYAGIVALSLAGLILFGIMDILESGLCRWKMQIKG